jgi:gliding motility-associated-like protein
MQKMICLIALFINLHSADAQGTWTWLGGDTGLVYNTYNRGQKGVTSSLTYPDVFHYYSYVWQDASGKVWFFKISNWTYFDSPNKNAEVWSYVPESNLWTWEAGYDSFQFVNTSATNINFLKSKNYYDGAPPTWTDSLGNAWYYMYNYIVRFNIQSKTLEVMRYHNSAVNYGVQGVPSTSTWPGLKARSLTWSMGRYAYVFGGLNTNDLWKFDMLSLQWTWLGSTGTRPASFGTKGVASPSNWPPISDIAFTQWSKYPKLYLYGGIGNGKFYGDLWEYDVTTNLWTWLQGPGSDTLTSHPGVYPSATCKDTPDIYPSARVVRNLVKTSVCDNSFWLYGGWINTTYGASGDLWLYKPNVNQWMWIRDKPQDTHYFYGQRGIPDLKNRPPNRAAHLMFTDKHDRLYVFGGNGYDIYDPINNFYRGKGNDLWRYDPDYSCINYSLSEKFIDRNIKYRLCIGDSAVVKIREGYDSLRVIPMTNVSIKGNSTTGAEITLRPPVNRSYKIIAYGYRCESYLDSLTVPLQVFPTRASTEAKTICYGQSYMGKSTTGTHVFTYRDPLSCDSTHTLSLTVRLQIISSLDTTICEGQTVRGKTTTGSYADTLTAASGCDSIARLNLTVIPKFLAIDTSICRGKSFYGYSAAGTYLDTLTSSQGCITYRTLRLGIRELSSSTHTHSICEGQSYWGHSTTGTHTDILTAANGCDSTRTLNLTVNKKSFFTLNQEICRGESYEGKSQAGTYLDTFLNAKGCDSIRTLVLSLRNPRIIKKLKDTAICRGSEAILDAGFGHKDYLWSTGELSPSILVKNEGEYKLSYTDTANCKGRDSAKVKYHNDTEIILQDEISNYKGELLFLNPQIKPSDAGGKYRWSPSQIFQCDSCRSAKFKLDNSAVVRLEFTDAQGCKAYKDVKVNIYDSWAVGFPAAFSPNGDALNDTYFPNVANILSYTYSVYNRWGEKVYQATNIQPAWNGTFRGQPCPMGMYSYYADVILLNGVRRTYSGSFQVVR